LHPIGEYLIANIEENGYLECGLEEAVMQFNVPLEEVEKVLALIQSFDPPGVAARDIQECLRLQLESLSEQNLGNRIALAMVRDMWEDMLASRIGRIARRLKVSAKEVGEALDYIKGQSGRHFSPGVVKTFLEMMGS
jgi:RNA polymerase sigma-54 factor